MSSAGTYPAAPSARDRFVLERRSARPPHDPWQYQGLIVEDERTADGHAARMATVFLTGRECPWRCAMCDLWRYTTPGDTPAGAIAAQVAAARAALRDQRVAVAGIKLYNAGSFFDVRAVPVADYAGVAAALAGLSRVVVESHPALVGEPVDRFLALLDRHRGDADRTLLEVAIGLETAHPVALERLNKRMSVERFAEAAAALAQRGVALRVFLLISPPFIAPDEQDGWLAESVDVAFSSGASVVSLVPTRPGNGAIDALAGLGMFRVPDLADIERSFPLALAAGRGRGRVFADVWDLDRFAPCRSCAAPRRARLEAMNLAQRVLPQITCRCSDRGIPR